MDVASLFWRWKGPSQVYYRLRSKNYFILDLSVMSLLVDHPLTLILKGQQMHVSENNFVTVSHHEASHALLLYLTHQSRLSGLTALFSAANLFRLEAAISVVSRASIEQQVKLWQSDMTPLMRRNFMNKCKNATSKVWNSLTCKIPKLQLCMIQCYWVLSSTLIS